MDIVKAIQESCDVFFYEPAIKVGIDKIAKVAKDFGFGQSNAEKSITEEASYLVKYFQENSKPDEDFLIHECFNVFVANVIWQIVAGTRCYEDSDEKKLLSLMEEFFIGFPGTVSFFTGNNPLAQMIFSRFIQKRKILYNSLHDLMMKVIDRNDKILDEKAPR